MMIFIMALLRAVFCFCKSNLIYYVSAAHNRCIHRFSATVEDNADDCLLQSGQDIKMIFFLLCPVPTSGHRYNPFEDYDWSFVVIK